MDDAVINSNALRQTQKHIYCWRQTARRLRLNDVAECQVLRIKRVGGPDPSVSYAYMYIYACMYVYMQTM